MSMSAVQINKELKKLKLNLKEKNPELLFGSQKVCQEFLKLQLPVYSEILDVGARSGFLSASLQAHGYTNIDTIIENLSALAQLKSLKLHRNMICQGLTGLNSTGLRENTYDVIVTSSHSLNPTNITELFRILKPGGHLFFIMYSSMDVRLLDINLSAFEKEGKCEVIRKERFFDQGCLIGDFYIVRAIPEKLPPYLKKPVSKALEDSIKDILVDNSDIETRNKFYDSWSAKYDEDLVVIGHYTGHIKCVEAFLRLTNELNLRHDIQILDVAAGTGLLGAEIVKHGFENIDAVDSSLGMLAQANKQGIYKNYIHSIIDRLGSIPVNNETYDVLIMSNGFAPGQIYPSSLPEMLRTLRHGGYILWTMKDGYHTTSHRFSMMDQYIEDLRRQGLVTPVVEPVVFQKYMQEPSGKMVPGRFYMLRKNVEREWATGSPKLPRKMQT